MDLRRRAPRDRAIVSDLGGDAMSDAVKKWQDKTAPLRMMGSIPSVLDIGDELVDEINLLGCEVEELQQELLKWDPGMEF